MSLGEGGDLHRVNSNVEKRNQERTLSKGRAKLRGVPKHARLEGDRMARGSAEAANTSNEKKKGSAGQKDIYYVAQTRSSKTEEKGGTAKGRTRRVQVAQRSRKDEGGREKTEETELQRLGASTTGRSRSTKKRRKR